MTDQGNMDGSGVRKTMAKSKSSGLTTLQLMDKGQWSSVAAMANYLHDDDEAKQDAQMKRIKRRAKQARQAKRK